MAPNFKIITLRENKSYSWQTFVRVIKWVNILTGLLARRWCKSPKPFVYDKFAEKKPWFRSGSKTADFAWFHTPYYPLCTTYGIKAPVENKAMGLAYRSLVSPFLSFNLWLSSHLESGGPPSLLILPGLLRSDQGGLSVSSPMGEQKDACGLRKWCKLLGLKFYWFSV